MPLFLTTWRKLLVISVGESELQLFKKRRRNLSSCLLQNMWWSHYQPSFRSPCPQGGQSWEKNLFWAFWSWESCWAPQRVCYKTCSNTRCVEWVPLTLEGQRITLEATKTPNRAEKQYHSDWIQPSGRSSKAHPPHHSSHVDVAQCSALKISKGALAWTEVQRDSCSLQLNLGIEHSSPLGWPWIYSTSEQENPRGHGKDHCGGPHRDIWPQVPTVSSMTWMHGQEKLRRVPHL